MIERWKSFRGLFEVSNHGNIRDLNGNPIKIYNTRYLSFRHGGVQYVVHRVVAETFIDNPYHKREVNHIDGDKHNNAVSNLEWSTTSENRKHAFENGLEKPTYGFKGKHHTQEQKDKISKNNAKYWLNKDRPSMFKSVKCVETGIIYDSIKSAKKATGATHIGATCDKHQETSGKYHWEWVGD